MALSASTNFSVNRDELINASLRVLGVVGQGYAATANEISDGAQALNMLLKLLHGDGMALYLTKNKSITQTATTTSYTLGPAGTIVMDRPTRIISAQLRETSSSEDSELSIVSQAEYLGIPNKAETGQPTTLHYDPQLTSGVLYVWPAATTAIAASHTIQLRYSKPIDDMDASSNDFEIPQVWYEPLKLLLAVSMAPEYDSVPLRKLQWLEQRAEYLRSLAMGIDNETTSVTFSPA